MIHTKKLAYLNVLRRLCAGAVIFGFVCSAAGNVLHADRNPISIALALGAPSLFGIMFEIVSRVVFRKEASLILKGIALFGAGSISGIMAWISYWHQKAAFMKYGDATQATLLPLAIDGLMVIGSVYLIELGFQIRDLEAWIAAGGNVRKVTQDVPAKKDREPTKRDKIIQILAKAPELDAKALAAAAGTSYNYAYSVATELRKRDSELATA